MTPRDKIFSILVRVFPSETSKEYEKATAQLTELFEQAERDAFDAGREMDGDITTIRTSSTGVLNESGDLIPDEHGTVWLSGIVKHKYETYEDYKRIDSPTKA